MNEEEPWACTEMEIEEADVVTLADNVTSADVICASSATGLRRNSEKSAKGGNSKSTQTSGHVFLGKQGEVIITSNYTLVKLVVNNDTVQSLTSTGPSDVERITDTVMRSLARLEWNGERILEKAMTSFRLTLTQDLMPQLLKEVADLMLREKDHHRVQHLAQILLEQHLIKFFGMDVSSLVFILEHSSVDDASRTLESPSRQQELQALLMTLLPGWVSPLAQWTVTAYTLTPEDVAQNFGLSQRTEVPFVASVPRAAEGSAAVSDRGVERRNAGEDSDLMESSSSHTAYARGPDDILGQSEVSTAREERRTETRTSEEPPASSSPAKPSQAFTSSAQDSQPSTSSAKEPQPSSSSSSPSGTREGFQGGLWATEGAAGGAEGMVAAGGRSEGQVVASLSSRGLLRLQDVNTDSIPKQEVHLRLVIVGRTGSGKSSTANSIMGQQRFPEAASFSSVTTECQMHTAARDGLNIEILDSPGLFDSTLSTQAVSNMVLSAVSCMEEGPDALLYVIKIGVRYTEEEFAVYTLLKALLDENVTRYIIVIFTHGDALQGREIQGLLRKPESLVRMLRECGNRYVVFDNTAANKAPQVNQLLSLVRQVQQQNQGRRYRCPRYAEKLDEIDLELEVRLLKAEQERLQGKTHIQFLQAQLAQTEQQLKDEAEQFARHERASKKKLEQSAEDMRKSLAELTQSLMQGQMQEEERQKQLQALKDRVAEEERRAEQKTRQLKEQNMAERKKRNEEMQRLIESLRVEREHAERLAEERRGHLMSMMTAVARSRRRRNNECCVM